MDYVRIRLKEFKKYLFGERLLIVYFSLLIGICIYIYTVEFYTVEFSIFRYLNEEKETINFYSGTKNGGIYYRIGQSLHEANNCIKNKSSSGGYENAFIVISDRENSTFGLVQEEAYLKDNFVRANLNYVVPLYLERMHAFYKADEFKNERINLTSYNNIEFLKELLAKKINIGPVGSGTNILSGYVIDELNKQIERHNLIYKDTVKYIGDSITNYNLDRAFKDEIPIIFTVAGAPFKEAINILNSNQYKLINIDPLLVNKINQEKNLGLRAVTFNNKYKNGKRFNTFATTAYLVTKKTTKPATIKTVLKCFDNENFKSNFYRDIGLVTLKGKNVTFPENFKLKGIDTNGIYFNPQKSCLVTNDKTDLKCQILPLEKETSDEHKYYYLEKDVIEKNDTIKLIEVQPHFRDIFFKDIYLRQFDNEARLIWRNILLFIFSIVPISVGAFILITRFLSAVKYHKFFNEIIEVIRVNVPDNALLNKDSIVRMKETELEEFKNKEKNHLACVLNKDIDKCGVSIVENNDNLDLFYKNQIIKYIDDYVEKEQMIKSINDGDGSEIIYERDEKLLNKLASLNKYLFWFLSISGFILMIIGLVDLNNIKSVPVSVLAIITGLGVFLYIIVKKWIKEKLNRKFRFYKKILDEYVKTNPSSDLNKNKGNLIKVPYLKEEQIGVINRIVEGISRTLLIKIDIVEDYSDGGLKEKDYIFLMKNCNEVLLMLKKSLRNRLLKYHERLDKEVLYTYLTADYLEKDDFDGILEIFNDTNLHSSG